MSITPEQLDEIEKMAEAATPGPWAQEVWQGNDDTGGWAAIGFHQESTDCICEGEEERTACAGELCADDRSQNDEEQAWKDAAFIRAMREHALPLVKALREAHAEVGRLRVENKFLRERPIPEGRIHQAMTGYVMDLRALVLEHEWVTDGRECVVYCLWCKQAESNGHANACEMFGAGGLIPIDPKTKRPAPMKSLRERGCQCQWEAGDSACPVHGEESL